MPTAIEQTIPYTMRLPGGRTVFIEIPAQYVEHDISGEIVFTPEGGHFLDRIRVLAMNTPENPTRGYLQTVREALKLTQDQFAREVGRDAATIQGWEAGAIRPDEKDRKRIQEIITQAARRGVIVAA